MNEGKTLMLTFKNMGLVGFWVCVFFCMYVSSAM